jgi:uncharacterized protein
MAFMGVSRKRGEVLKQRVVIGEFSDSSPVLLPVVTITGRRDGPTVFVQAAVHGDEVTGTAIARGVIADIKPDDISGSVVVVPVSNVPAFLTRSRGWTMEERLASEVNRLYPGWSGGLLSERMAHLLFTEFILQSDLTIDLHTALDGCDIVPFTYVLPDEEDGTYDTRFRVAYGFGTPYIYRIDQVADQDRSQMPLSIRGMSRGALGKTGRARMTAEMGESRRVSHECVPIGIRGVRRSLQIMGVLPGEPEKLKEPQRSFSKVTPVHVNRGGGLHLTAKLGDDVKRGQRVGEVVDVFGDIVEELISPVDGFVQRIMKFGNVATGAEAYWLAS